MNFSELQVYIQLLLSNELQSAEASEQRRKTMNIGDWVELVDNYYIVGRIVNIDGVDVTVESARYFIDKRKSFNVKRLRKFIMF